MLQRLIHMPLLRASRTALLLALAVLPIAAMPTQSPPTLALDETNGVGGLQFGARIEQIAGFDKKFVRIRGIGKRWRTTHLYSRPGDTTTLAGVRVPLTYWFRLGRFIGVDATLKSPTAYTELLHHLSARYGSPRADTIPEQWHWLGHHSYLLLEKTGRRTGNIFAASLDMLNEQVYETALRARARRELGWRPDSVGLPHQFPVK
ncbi:hypothetical protein [Hymenobacter terrenus]|uniref:hypothetical protein n=1 Tax=Hymenobacter terrenus TaxID=1629124 RepID=UPI001E48ED1E|nr:hypothetical protein [Hymenobacter terrenus]